MKTRTKVIWIILALLLLVAAIVAAKFFYDVTSLKRAFAQDFAQNASQAQEQTALPEIDSEEASQTMDSASPTNEQSASPSPDPLAELEAKSDETFMKNRINLLLLGLDRSTEREKWNSFRTDTMILLSIDFDSQEVDMISIPRDSYVKIHNKKSRDKVNTAFGTGGGAEKNGYEYAMKTVSKLLGAVPVNYYVGFDMNVVKEVVDAMGGVAYDVDIDVKMNGRVLAKGQQQLDGQQVLDYCRQRKGSSDIARVERQQNMLMAIFSQLKSSGQLANVPEIYKAVEKNIDTNLNFKQICSLALFGSDLSLDGIEKHTIEGEFLNMNGISYWGVSNTKLKKLVKEVFGKSFSPDADGDVYSIKRELQVKTAKLGAKISDAQAKLRKAEALLQSGQLSEQELAKLQAAVAALNAACENEDIEQIDAAIAQCNAALSGLPSDETVADSVQGEAEQVSGPSETEAQSAAVLVEPEKDTETNAVDIPEEG